MLCESRSVAFYMDKMDVGENHENAWASLGRSSRKKDKPPTQNKVFDRIFLPKCLGQGQKSRLESYRTFLRQTSVVKRETRFPRMHTVSTLRSIQSQLFNLHTIGKSCPFSRGFLTMKLDRYSSPTLGHCINLSLCLLRGSTVTTHYSVKILLLYCLELLRYYCSIMFRLFKDYLDYSLDVRGHMVIHYSMTYKIIRKYFDNQYEDELLADGLTREGAQHWCRDPESSSNTAVHPDAVKRTEEKGLWFEVYTEEWNSILSWIGILYEYGLLGGGLFF